MTSTPAPPRTQQHSIGRSAFLVAAGIFLSRIFGLVRESVFAHYFGLSFAADAFRAALRIPNILQNLFGEGALSASFIPVYAWLVAHRDDEEAGRVAGAVFSLLAFTMAVLVLLGVLATPWLIDLIAPGFEGGTRALTIQLVRIFFPGIGLMVLSAWCLGILNSHGRFFLSYVSPVIWNVAQITTLLVFGRSSEMPKLAAYTAWAAVVGSGLQFLAQLPVVLSLVPALRLWFRELSENVRTIIRNFFPIFVSRGVTQLSAYIDTLLASFLPTGAVAALFNAQALYLLPVSLFGMSVSAAELPAMSSTLGNEQEVAEALRRRIESSTRRIAFLVVPSAMAFFALGDVIAAAIFQSGRFHRSDTDYVWGILAGSAVGLVAATVGRLYSSAYYALRDTKTPLRYAIVRVLLTTALGYFCALHLPGLLGQSRRWGAAGLTASYGIAAWVEFLLLRRGMERRVGQISSSSSYFAKLWTSAFLAAVLGWVARSLLHPHHPWVTAIVALVPYGAAYFGLTALMGIDQSGALLTRLRRLARRA
ncbi:MAG TPA: murein biosynthesis integral membrane protein MurJ [Candidatus Limnocylindrales bacterium]|nr:murein biosynthesis integral membrane protein MurJ [Candidatus Limnocylindrales bacterium]